MSIKRTKSDPASESGEPVVKRVRTRIRKAAASQTAEPREKSIRAHHPKTGSMKKRQAIANALSPVRQRPLLRKRTPADASSARPRKRPARPTPAVPLALMKARGNEPCWLPLRVFALCLAFCSIAILPFPRNMASSSTFEYRGSSLINTMLPALTDNIGPVEPLSGSLGNLPTPLHYKVRDYIDYFNTEGRETLQGWLDRSAQYYPMMKEIFRQNGLPEDLVFVAMIESGFNPHSVSRADATGPWQFVSSTAQQYGLRIDQWVDERKDPIKSTHAAAEHLKYLSSRFGSWPLALASYNAGLTKVQRAVRVSGSRDLWGRGAAYSIPRETRDYVPKFMAVATIASNLPAFGFTLPKVRPFLYDEIEIAKTTSLRTIAARCKTTVQQLKLLNPELKREATPPDTTPYLLRIPKGTDQACRITTVARAQKNVHRRGIRDTFTFEFVPSLLVSHTSSLRVPI